MLPDQSHLATRNTRNQKQKAYSKLSDSSPESRLVVVLTMQLEKHISFWRNVRTDREHAEA
jgi:hypothetical protein